MGKLLVGVIILVAVIAFWMRREDKPTVSDTPAADTNMKEDDHADTSMSAGTQSDTASTTPASGQVSPVTGVTAADGYKEFTVESFYDDKGAWFSVKAMQVKKGDKVRIKVTNTKGMHDFALNEYGIKKETPLNQPVAIEFTADKVGEFTYYCSKPGHRERGQWGTLTVI